MTSVSGGTESTVLIELVENLVSLAAAAELSASTAAEAAANNSTSSADQTFIVISGELISFHQKLRFLFCFCTICDPWGCQGVWFYYTFSQ